MYNKVFFQIESVGCWFFVSFSDAYTVILLMSCCINLTHESVIIEDISFKCKLSLQ